MIIAEERLRLVLELRQSGISDSTVLSVIETLPRDVFLTGPFKARAFENTALPIGYHQTISQPFVVAMMTQALKLNDRHKVLEIGTGSGYQAAVLSRLCRRVYTIERHPPLLAEAEERFKTLRIHNITAIVGDGNRGWPEQAPFDRIMVTAAAAEAPERLIDQLAVGGVMVLPLGAYPDDQRIFRITKTEDGLKYEDMLPVRFVPLLPGVANNGNGNHPED